jgi:hypothetical protein
MLQQPWSEKEAMIGEGSSVRLLQEGKANNHRTENYKQEYFLI